MASTQQSIDNQIHGVMQTLENDILLGKIFDGLGLLLLIDANILSPRQIAKKITSYSINPSTGVGYTDQELNLIYYGQDLTQVYPEYQIPFQDEQEYMVNFDGNPVDIRDQVKDKIHEIIRETRKELMNFEIQLKHLISNIPRAITQAVTSILSVTTPQVTLPPLPMIVSNPAATAQVAGNLHNTALVIRKIVLEAILAIKIFSTLPKLTVGESFNANILIPQVLPNTSLNRAKPIKVPINFSVPQIPKIKFLLSDTILNLFYDVLSIILSILQFAADIVVALDTLAVALETATAALNGSLSTLLAEQASLYAMQNGISQVIGNLKSTLPAGVKLSSPKNIPSPNPVNYSDSSSGQPGNQSGNSGSQSETGAALLTNTSNEATNTINQASSVTASLPQTILSAYTYDKSGNPQLYATFSNFIFTGQLGIQLGSDKSNLVISAR
jgi:hypothetical protein